ncbi:MAG: hypothetical protein QGG67_08885 [Gammaproteobacteria bacterium]|jgi:hypothetical protein|nr:hypothetical protein [Gammaproteobacteria bacterium]HJO12354.1 hypothetical protein [Gammaproteobacteria bacterium]|tara:strand:+ start:2780 stop:3517 length:738 start_codon:yes stop_codon:yes gene_type:complete
MRIITKRECVSFVTGPLLFITHALLFLLVTLVWSASLLAADLPVLDLDKPIRPNFSGSWEKDFRRSDDWETELNRTIQQIQREAELLSRQSSGGRSSGNLRSGRRGRSNVVDLARLAEFISRQSTITITQNNNEVRIEREGDAALICGLGEEIMESFSSKHGTEICGWEQRQLVFQISLTDSVTILHRFTVSSNNQSLNLVTSISSGNSTPFNLIQVFQRYDAPPDEFNCEQTLSRGIVCRQTQS